MQQYNKDHEAINKAAWEEREVVRRAKLKRPPKKPRQWKYTEANGAMVRKATKGGIDWIRYRFEVLEKKFIPFLRSLGPRYIA